MEYGTSRKLILGLLFHRSLLQSIDLCKRRLTTVIMQAS